MTKKLPEEFLNNTIGLTEYLYESSLNKEEIITKGKYPNLDIIFAGKIPPNPHSLVNSEKLKDLILKLKNEYDYVLIDSTAIGMFSETKLIYSSTDTIFYVIRFDVTDYRHLKFSIEDSIPNNLDTIFLINGVSQKYLLINRYGVNLNMLSNYIPVKWWKIFSK